MTSQKQNSLFLAIILFVSIYILAPFYQNPWFPQTADGEYYSARLGNFYSSLQHGSIPPRLAPTFYSGMGYPVFNFNYPIPNIFGSIFIFLGSTVQYAIKATIVISYIAGGFGIYFLFKDTFKNSLASLAGSLLYLTAPYQIHDIFHRATTGEIMMLGLLPFVLITLKKRANNQINPSIAALIYAMYFLTHNLYSLLFLPLIISFVWVHYGLDTFKKNAAPIFAGFLISMFFWIPALAEMKYTVLSTARINHDYPTELLSLAQTLKIPGNYAPKVDPPTLDSDQPGFAQLFILVTSIFYLIFSKTLINKKQKKYILVSIIFIFGGLFLINEVSLPIWQTFSFIRFIQHPIRLFFIPVFFGAYLGAFLIKSSKFRWIIITTCIALTIYNYKFFAFRPVNYVPFDDAFFYKYPLTSAADNEFDTIWYDRRKVNDFLITHDEEKIIASPSGEIIIDDLDLFKKEYQVSNKESTTIIEKILYFPGWQTFVNGEKIDTFKSAGRYYGFINYDLPPGEHQITTKFTQQTPARIIGNTISIVGIILAVRLFFRSKHEK